MRSYLLVGLALASGWASAKICFNQTVSVTISARTGIFNLAVPSSHLDATTFAQNITQQGRNFTDTVLTGYKTTAGTYSISTQFCKPTIDTSKNPTVQILTHGIGADKTYWDAAYNNFSYSYVNVATDQYKYCTLTYDRLGIGNSSHGEALNEIQSFLEVAALAEITQMLRHGTFPKIKHAFEKIIHVGHSFGSAQTYSLVNMYPNISDGIILTGFSTDLSHLGLFVAGANFQIASLNQPLRLGNLDGATVENVLNNFGLTDIVAGVDIAATPRGLNYPAGYIVLSNINALDYVFFQAGNFDPGVLLFSENNKQPATVGEILTLGSVPPTNAFGGPVMVFTGSGDVPFCGGNCLATGTTGLASIPAGVAKSFPKVAPSNFTAYIQPNTNHGINYHYNATAGYKVIQQFLGSKNLQSS